jgi:dCMP deaminase
MTDPRPGWSEYFLGIADAVSARGDCTRRQVGAVLVDPDTHDLIETGYNGMPARMPGCLSAGACPRGRHYKLTAPNAYGVDCYSCACGWREWPCPDTVAPGSSYDTGPGACGAVHAEANALLRAGKNARGAHLYLTTEPCDGCMKLIRGAGVMRVIWPGGNLEL